MFICASDMPKLESFVNLCTKGTRYKYWKPRGKSDEQLEQSGSLSFCFSIFQNKSSHTMHAARSLTAAVRAAGPAAGVAKSVASGLRAGAAAIPTRNVYLKKHEQDQDVKSFTMVCILL